MEFTRCYGCMEELTAYPCPHCGYHPRMTPTQWENIRIPMGPLPARNGHETQPEPEQ